MKFAIFDVMEKGLYLGQALEAAGHERATFPDVDVVILDCDWAWAQPRPQIIQEAFERNIKVALYPHGGQPTVFVYDGLTKPHPAVDVRFEHGPRNLDIAERLGLKLNQACHGWLYSPTAPFAAVKDPKRVLFAPLHPNIEAMQKGGPDIAPKLNQAVYRQLLALDFEVTVSVVGPLWRNGIWAHPRATMAPNHEMRFTHLYQLLHDADIVIAAGTAAAAAVACGKPAVFLDVHDCADYLDGQYRQSDHAAELVEQMRYPLVAGDGPLEDLIRVACDGSEATRMWRDWWVGDDGTAEAVRILGHLVGEQMAKKTKKAKVPGTYKAQAPKQQNVTIQGVRATLGSEGRAPG